MIQSQKAQGSWKEYLIITLGFSIYAGWVTAASILNVCFLLKSNGMDQNEQEWGIVIMWVAIVIYNVAAFREKNPVYGLVFLWVIVAINSNAVTLGYDKIESMSNTITYAHAASMALQLAYLACRRFKQ